MVLFQMEYSISTENIRNSDGFHYFLRVYYNDSGNEVYASVKIIHNILRLEYNSKIFPETDRHWLYYHSMVFSHPETKICGVVNSFYIKIMKRRTLEKSLGNLSYFVLTKTCR